MNTKNKDIGKYGEKIACEFLQKKGFKILHTNWRYSNLGEIDIIAKIKETLVFIEVKTRSSHDFGHPLEAINPKKFDQLKKTAMLFLSQSQIKYKDYRLDAIAIILKPEIQISHIENIF